MTAYYGSNVNSVLYSGGSGSGMVGDGYIRTVEKVWIETFNFSAVVTTADSVCIAVLPGNKKITGVDVFLPVGFAPTNATINVGTGLPATAGVLTTYCSILISNSTAYALNAPTLGALFLGRVSMMPTSYSVTGGVNFPYVTTTSTVASSGGAAVIADQTRVYMFIGITAMTAPTAGTFTTIVRYT